MHPTLPFATQQIENRYFRVGLEGIRYEPGWSDGTSRAAGGLEAPHFRIRWVDHIRLWPCRR